MFLKMHKAANKRQQADLVKLSPFLQKAAKMPPSCPNRCGGRYTYMKKILISLLCLLSSAAEASDLVLLGSIAIDCENYHIENLQADVRLKIKPNEAVKIAIDQNLIKCNSKLEQQVYSDNKNYYIIKSVNAAFGNIEQNSVIINGENGRVFRP